MAFYDDMAATAKELITEFGFDVTLRFNNGTHNPTTGAKTTSNTDTATKGIFTNINKTLRDDFSVMDGDRVCVLISDVEPTKNAKLLVDSVAWQIVNIKQIKPSTTTIVYFVQVRK